VLGEEALSLTLQEEERSANYIAGAILAPASTLRRAHLHFGNVLRPIAKAFGMSDTAMHLRLAEVLKDERAVVTKRKNIFIRSQGKFPWEAVDVVAVARGEIVDPRIEVVPMRGLERGRAALRVR
jgi:hypothetical protein